MKAPGQCNPGAFIRREIIKEATGTAKYRDNKIIRRDDEKIVYNRNRIFDRYARAGFGGSMRTETNPNPDSNSYADAITNSDTTAY